LSSSSRPSWAFLRRRSPCKRGAFGSGTPPHRHVVALRVLSVLRVCASRGAMRCTHVTRVHA
jgi:hypothetical protein